MFSENKILFGCKRRYISVKTHTCQLFIRDSVLFVTLLEKITIKELNQILDPLNIM